MFLSFRAQALKDNKGSNLQLFKRTITWIQTLTFCAFYSIRVIEKKHVVLSSTKRISKQTNKQINIIIAMNGEETRLIASQADRRERFAKIVLTRSYLEAKVS